MAAQVRVVQISDTHLSGTRAYAAANFDRVVDWLNANPPAAVINTGDIGLDDPDDTDDQRFAHHLHERIAAPLFVVPGNHDIGDSGPQPWQDQRVTPERLAHFVEVWGADRFSVDVGQWRLIGLNNLVIGELADADHDQAGWLRDQLRGADQVGVFMHKPICIEELGKADLPGWAMDLSSRASLLALLRSGPVRFVASGHLHRSRSAVLNDGMPAVWAPSTAFVPAASALGPARCGVVEYVFDGPTVQWVHVEPPGIVHPTSEQYADGADAMRRAPLFPYRGT